MIKELFEKIFGEEVIKETMHKLILEKLNANDFTFCQIFVDLFLKQERSKLSILFKNYENLKYFAGMLNIISSRISNIDDEFFEMNFAILFIGERSYCKLDKDKKLYLCNLLSSKNKKLYNAKKFWTNLITFKIDNKIVDICKKYSCIILYNYIFNVHLVKLQTQTNNSKEEVQTKGGKNKTILSNIKNTFIGIFGKEKSSGSSVMSVEQIIELEHLKSQEIITILKEFINHFSNFNVEIAESIDIITTLSKKYNINQNHISNLLSFLNSCSFTIKNLNNKEINNIIPKKSKNDLILEKALNYLNVKDGVNLLLLNKAYNNKLRKRYYRNILRYEKLDVDSRIRIWKLILKTVSIVN